MAVVSAKLQVLSYSHVVIMLLLLLLSIADPKKTNDEYKQHIAKIHGSFTTIFIYKNDVVSTTNIYIYISSQSQFLLSCVEFYCKLLLDPTEYNV
jgi:hypothetical protein